MQRYANRQEFTTKKSPKKIAEQLEIHLAQSDLLIKRLTLCGLPHNTVITLLGVGRSLREIGRHLAYVGAHMETEVPTL